MPAPPNNVNLRIVPATVERARNYVLNLHRHNPTPPPQSVFAVGIVDDDHKIRGVALVGRPVARVLDDGQTLEVNRCCTDGVPNGCSMLYGASRRIARELGYARLLTYIRVDEPGSSLRASGWVCEGEIRGHSWNSPSRHRVDKTEIINRQRWSVLLNDPVVGVEWPVVDDGQSSLFDALTGC